MLNADSAELRAAAFADSPSVAAALSNLRQGVRDLTDAIPCTTADGLPDPPNIYKYINMEDKYG